MLSSRYIPESLILPASGDQLQKMLQTNVHGTMYCIKHAGSVMMSAVKNGQANGITLRIIVAGSLAGKRGKAHELDSVKALLINYLQRRYTAWCIYCNQVCDPWTCPNGW